MSRRHVPEEFPTDDITYHQDLQWQRGELARNALSISDVLSTIDDLIAANPVETDHPIG